MQIIDNINKTVKDDLQVGIHKGSKMSVAAACFSIYAYQELKKQLDGIDELRFIFTSPTFVTEKASKAQRMEMNAELKNPNRTKADDMRRRLWCAKRKYKENRRICNYRP